MSYIYVYVIELNRNYICCVSAIGIAIESRISVCSDREKAIVRETERETERECQQIASRRPNPVGLRALTVRSTKGITSSSHSI